MAAGTLSDIPLFLATSAKPNIMLMLDNSGSMINIVPEAPYDPATTYLQNCPPARLIPPGSNVEIRISGGPKIRYSGTSYSFGTGSGQKCFAADALYRAELNANNGTGPSGSLPADYTGNYLNWYFDPDNTTPPWTNQEKKPGTHSRLEIAKPAAKALIDSLGAVRVGLSAYDGGDGGSLREAVGDIDATKKITIKNKIDDLTASGRTPLAETLSDIGHYFTTGYSGNLLLHPGQPNEMSAAVGDVFNGHSIRNDTGGRYDDPIQFSCQKNFTVLVTDGRPQSDRNIDPLLRDYSGDCEAGLCNSTPTSGNLPGVEITGINSGGGCSNSNPYWGVCKNGTKAGRTYESQGSDYLDDVAQALFEMDLRPDLEDVKGVKNNLITYTIGFADLQVLNNPLLHDAATRGGGLFVGAKDTTDLTAAFQTILSDIGSKRHSASAVATNSTRLDTNTMIYQALFDTTDWSGRLVAWEVDSLGIVDTATPNWDASALLPVHGSRNIYTYDPTAQVGSRGVPFQWSSLNGTQQAHLHTIPYSTVTDKNGELRLNWLRGDDSDPNNLFRSRSNLLGDIVNSDPAFVGTQDYGYGALPGTEGSSYTQFRSSESYQNRRPMVYIGANDGMLHGFDARKNDGTVTSGGTEVLAYVPNAIFPHLSRLPSPTYKHQYYVDGSPAVGDAYIGGNWHTLLAGTTAAAGRAVFTLDVTDPDNFGPASALWEFTNADDSDVGYTLAQPSIARMHDGSWAVIVANGYNSDNGHAVLFVLDARTGSVLTKIDTGAGSPTDKNGLSTPLAVDADNDFIVDYIYAGDLYGNLWKFDVTSKSAAAWDVAYKGSTAPEPLFVSCAATETPCSRANRQPITGKPAVGSIGEKQTGGSMIYFGTGKFFEVGDNVITNPQTQSFYGLWDKNTGDKSVDQIADRAQLTAQTIDYEGTAFTTRGEASGKSIRVTSDNTVCYSADSDPATCDSTNLRRGWYMDLISPLNGAEGERVVSLPIIRRGIVIFATLIPNSDECNFGGTSWLMELDAVSGARTKTPAFGLFGGTADAPTPVPDAVVNEADYVAVDGQKTTASGVQVDIGIHKQPAIVAGETVDHKFLSGSTGGLGHVVDAGDPSGSGGGGKGGVRRSWRQLR